jgi:hypothetical protein
VGQTPDCWGNDFFDDTYFHNGKSRGAFFVEAECLDDATARE